MRWSRDGAVLWRAVSGYLALALADGTRLAVHGPGAEVWELLEQPADLDHLVDTLAHRYSADRHTVHGDLRRLLDELERGGYVTHDG